MAKLPILIYGSPILRKKAKAVERVDGVLQRLIDEMVETMYAAPGMGLAANQVGVPLRLLVMNPSEERDPKDLVVIINPEIVSSEGEEFGEEGCLSIPEVREEVARYKHVLVHGYDREGREIEISGQGLVARILQHEIDHLDGILFIDRLSTAKKELIKQRLRRILKEKGLSLKSMDGDPWKSARM